MLKSKQREMAETLERHIKHYEVLLERTYNVGEILSRDEIQWMKDFANPDRHIHGLFYQLRKVNDLYVDMVLNKFESLKRKEHGLKMVQKSRDYGGVSRPGGAPKSDMAEFYAGSHPDVDTLVNDLVLAIHKKSGGMNPTTMDRYVKQIRKKVNKVLEENPETSIQVKAAVNRSTNQIEVRVETIKEEE